MLEPLLELDPELALPDGTRARRGAGRHSDRAASAGRLATPARWPDAAARARRAAGPAAAWPGKSGIARSASSPAGRPSIAGRRSSKVIASRRLAAIWRSAAFGGSAPSTPSAIQSSIRCSQPGQGREVGAHRLVVGAVHAVRGGDDRRRGLHGEPDRNPEPGALRVARERRRGRAAGRSRGCGERRAAGPPRPSARLPLTAARARSSLG